MSKKKEPKIIIIDFLMSFKPNVTVGEILKLIENEDIDLNKFISEEEYEVN